MLDMKFEADKEYMENLSLQPSTVKPVLRGHRIKWTVAEVPKFICLIYFK